MAEEPEVSEEITTGVPIAAQSQRPPPDILEIEPVYEVLGHSRRRYLCYTLVESTEWSLTDLATKIAAWENDIPEHAVETTQQKKVYVSLYHAHVPKLVEEGVVTFDEATETITAGQHAEQVLAALEGIGASLDSQQETHARGEMNEQES